MTNEEIDDKGFKEFIPIKQKKTKIKNGEEYDAWKIPEEKPNKNNVKQMWAELLAIATGELMNNHIYEFNGELRVKENEGSMGVEVTGVLADIKMIKWNIKFAKKLIDTLMM